MLDSVVNMFPARFVKGVGWLQDLEACEACQSFEDRWAVSRRLAKHTVYLQLLKRFFAGIVLYIQLNGRIQPLPIAGALQTRENYSHWTLSKLEIHQWHEKSGQRKVRQSVFILSRDGNRTHIFLSNHRRKHQYRNGKNGVFGPRQISDYIFLWNRNSAQGSGTPSIRSGFHDVGTWSSLGIHVRKSLQKRLNL